MSTINTVQPIQTEIVLQERVTTTEFRVNEIQESVLRRHVNAMIDLGPFTTDPNSGEQIPTSRRSIVVWEGTEYDVIRDTWNNADLLAAIQAKLA